MLHMNNTTYSREAEVEKMRLTRYRIKKHQALVFLPFAGFFFSFLLRATVVSFSSYSFIYLFVFRRLFSLCFDLSLKHTLTLAAMYRYGDGVCPVCLCVWTAAFNFAIAMQMTK